MTQKTDTKTAVLYNADCPVCSFEINHYADYSRREALPIRFDDLNDTNALEAWGIESDSAARRLHVVKDGEVLDGIPAFIALWQQMPRYHRLAKVVSLPGIYHIACAAYDYVLAPVIYWSHLRRVRKSARSL